MATPFNETIVVIPTYNEIDNIEKMISAIFSLSSDISLLIVDDSSPDGTGERVKALMENFPRLYLEVREKKDGLGMAYRHGFEWAIQKNYQYIVQMDCDFSHDPLAVPTLIDAAVNNDLCIGSRYVNGIRVINWPIKRLLLSLLGSLYTWILTGIPVLDVTGGFKCYKSSTLKNFNWDKIKSNGYAFQIECNFNAWVNGGKIKEVPIIFREREIGVSKMNVGIVSEALLTVLRMFFSHPFYRFHNK